MKTTFDNVDIVWGWLNTSPLKTAITGDIYRKRPINSKEEDVVINSLPVSNTQLQTSVINVNIHVPNLIQNLNSVQDNTQPDTSRLQALSSIAIGALKDKWGEDYNFDIQQQQVFEDEDGKYHYINIRIGFYSENF